MLEVAGIPVAELRVSVSGDRYVYESTHYLEEGPREHRVAMRLKRGAPLPEVLALLHRPKLGCRDVLEERKGVLEKLCVERSDPSDVSGTIAGEDFEAHYDDSETLIAITVGSAKWFEMGTPTAPPPVSPFVRGVTVPPGVLVLDPPVPDARWLARAPEGVGTPEEVGRVRCLLLARAEQARRPGSHVSVGLVIEEGRAYPHAWVTEGGAAFESIGGRGRSHPLEAALPRGARGACGLVLPAAVRRRARVEGEVMWLVVLAAVTGLSAGVGLRVHRVGRRVPRFPGRPLTAVVLGARVHPDGTPSPALVDRVRVGVALLKEGRAQRLLLSGGSPDNRPTEAFIMARLARELGAPEESLILEPKSRSTFENALRSTESLGGERGDHPRELRLSPRARNGSFPRARADGVASALAARARDHQAARRHSERTARPDPPPLVDHEDLTVAAASRLTKWQCSSSRPGARSVRGLGTSTATSAAVTLIEFSAFLSVIVGSITGAVAGARHGALGLVLGGVGGLASGFISFMAALSPMGLVSRGEARGLRAEFDELVLAVGFFLIPFAPVGAGLATWWLVRLFFDR